MKGGIEVSDRFLWLVLGLWIGGTTMHLTGPLTVVVGLLVGLAIGVRGSDFREVLLTWGVYSIGYTVGILINSGLWAASTTGL